MMKVNQKGSTPLVAIAIAALLAAGVFFIFSQQDDDEPVPSSQESSNMESESDPHGTDSQNQTQEPTNEVGKNELLIPELDLAVLLTDELSDLVYTATTSSVSFSSQGFLDKVEGTGFRYETGDSSGNCEQLAVIISKTRTELEELQNGEIYGALLDLSGDPLTNEVVLLEDGRYFLISGPQESCGKSPTLSDEYEDLANEEIEIRNSIFELMKNNLSSTIN